MSTYQLWRVKVSELLNPRCNGKHIFFVNIATVPFNSFIFSGFINEIMSAEVIFADENCNVESCNSKINELKEEIAAIEIKISESKAKYGQMLIENLKNDVKLEELNEKLQNLRYKEFSGDFAQNTLDVIRSIGVAKHDDPPFVRAAVQSLYASDLTVLKNKSVSGRSKNKNKTQITPKKRIILEKLFNRRMEIIAATEVIDEKRKNALTKHIKAAIENINKSIK